MTNIIILYLLAVLDFITCGYRSSQGRIALLDKRRFSQESIVTGVIWGHALLVVILLVIAAALAVSPDQTALWSELDQAAGGMLFVYTPYAILFFFALLMRLIPSIDVRSMAHTLFLGPMTFARPFVAVLGVVIAILSCPKPEIVFLGAFTIAAMLSLEVFLEWHNNYRADY